MDKIILALLIVFYAVIPLFTSSAKTDEFNRENVIVCDINTKNMCVYNIETKEFTSCIDSN